MIILHYNLKALREKRGLSQSQLAAIIGVSKSSINMYERGEREPSLETIEAIADYFNVNFDFLVRKEKNTSLRIPSDVEPDVLNKLQTVIDAIFSMPKEKQLSALTVLDYLLLTQEKNQDFQE